MRALLPSNEPHRLTVLRRCQILDTPPEAEFDDIVSLAAQFCAAPMAWLALVDEERIFFKARHNFDGRQMHRDGSPCAQTILEDDLLVVRDLALDPRFAVIENNGRPLRFYAAVPLVTHDGCALGTLAVVDYTPRDLEDEEKVALQALARQATLQMEWRRHAFKPAHPLSVETEDEEPPKMVESSSENRFRNAFEHAIIGMALLGLDGRFLTVNPSLCGIVGYTAQELLATNFQALTHRTDLEFDLDQMRQMLEGEILSYEVERHLNLRRGSEAWALLSVSLVRDSNGEPLYFLAQLQDITKRRQAEDELQAAHQESKVRVGELERHTREMNLIGEMGEFLQSCRSVGEAYKIMARTVRQLFPGTGGALFAFDANHDHVEAVVTWGQMQSETYFAPDDCWGLRRNRMHIVDAAGCEMTCPHMEFPEDWDGVPCQEYLCLPLTAQRETLGLLHLMAEKNQPLGEDRHPISAHRGRTNFAGLSQPAFARATAQSKHPRPAYGLV